MRRIADQTERARAAGTLDLGVETLRGEKIEQVSTEDLWTCPKSGAVTRIIGLEVTDPVYVLGAEEAMSRNPDKLPMVIAPPAARRSSRRGPCRCMTRTLSR
jgi:hypothetical protein